MNKPYSQTKALLAITKASFKAILKHPTAIIFSLGFPLIFVWIFGSFGGGGGSQFSVALDKKSDKSNLLVKILTEKKLVDFIDYTDSIQQRKDLEKGRLTAVMSVVADSGMHYKVHLKSTTATDAKDLAILQSMLKVVDYEMTKQMNPEHRSFLDIDTEVQTIRPYKNIDFVLPGQIGFSILFSTLFGIAFTFYNLREQLVLKRFYASPVNRLHILLGIGFSRLGFQLFNVVALLLLGKFWLGFTLVNGAATFIDIVILAIFLLLVLMGVGLVFSSIVKQDSTIPLLINVFALPQMLLGGTFFPITVFPSWMQYICKIFPLTHFNIAIRKISFEGLGLIDCWQNLAVLGVWMVVVYALVYKIFKWE